MEEEVNEDVEKDEVEEIDVEVLEEEKKVNVEGLVNEEEEEMQMDERAVAMEEIYRSQLRLRQQMQQQQLLEQQLQQQKVFEQQNMHEFQQ